MSDDEFKQEVLKRFDQLDKKILDLSKQLYFHDVAFDHWKLMNEDCFEYIREAAFKSKLDRQKVGSK